MKNFLIIGVIVCLLALYPISIYNTLITMSNNIDAQWAQVDSVLQRRFDAINQAIWWLKVSNKSEQDALQKITDARKIYTAAHGDTEAQVAQANNYAWALNGLLLSRAMVGENYPNLKTPDLVWWLIDGVKIEGNENRINVERQRYNDIVRDYNTLIMKFPTNMMAKLFGFLSKSYFELVNPEANQAPTIAPDISF